MSSPSRAFDPAPDAAQLDMLSPSRAFDMAPDAAQLNNLPSPSRAFDPAPDAAQFDMLSPSRAFDLLPNDSNLADLSPSRAFDLSMSPSRAFDPAMSPSRAFDPIPGTADHNMLSSPSRAFDPRPNTIPDHHLPEPAAVEVPAVILQPAAAEEPTAAKEPAVVEEPTPAEEPTVVPEPEAAKEPATVEQPTLPETDKPEERSSSPESSGSEDGEIDERSSPEPASPSRHRPSHNGHNEPEAARPTDDSANPPLPNEPLPGQAPPLPSEPVPQAEDDGWEAHWNPNTSSFWFYNRFTSVWQQENPRVPDAPATAVVAPVVVPETQDKTAISNPVSVAGGYNPAIHGDYDENAWYAQNARAINEPQQAVPTMVPHGQGEEFQYVNGAYFNRWTGQWQTPEQGPDRHNDEAKSKRQMNAYFDVDAAANMHDGRSLKAERANRKLTKAELKAFKEKRKAKKEEKRRAWLRD